MKNEDLISIFMPVYNGSNYLEKSITSILKQSYSNFELLCVDDSSKDNSFDILQKFAQKDARVRVFRKANGGNVPKSFNFVKPFIRGKFYMYMSQDDSMSPDNLECCFKKHYETEADVVMPKYVMFNQDGIRKIKCLSETYISGKEAFYRSLDWEVHSFCLWKYSLLKDFVMDESIFNTDEYMTRVLFLNANKVASSNSEFYYFTGNCNAITSGKKPSSLETLLCDNLVLALFKEYPNLSKIQQQKCFNLNLKAKFWWMRNIARMSWSKSPKKKLCIF